MKITRTPEPPTGFRAFLFRLPIRLYRMGAGWLLGHRFLYLRHLGRKSGRWRDVVLEVVRRDGLDYYACSGFGRRSQWYRNVLAHPQVTIQVGRYRTAARALPLGAEEGAEIMADYASRHPATAQRLCRAMGFAVDGSASDYREVGRNLPFVRFTPADTGC